MLEYCNVLKSVSSFRMQMAINQFFRTKSFDSFCNTISPKLKTLKTRFVKEASDELSDIEQANHDFISLFESVGYGLVVSHEQQAAFNDLRNQLNSLLIETDHSQLGSANDPNSDMDSGEDLKDNNEILDTNRGILQEHLLEIYGPGSSYILSRLNDNFLDSVLGAAYWNPNSGETPVQNKYVLNRNIQKYKDKMYSKIVQYMKSVSDKYADYPEEMLVDGVFNQNRYYTIMRDFYQHIKQNPNFEQTLQRDNIDLINKKDNTAKTSLYKQMMDVLLSNSDFRRTFENAFTNASQRDAARNVLYWGDLFSNHYYQIKKYIANKKLGNTQVGNKSVNQILAEIESEPNTLLGATNAYTVLTHFDELLMEHVGTAINFKKELKRIEVGDLTKYDYHQDTAHEKKSWQAGESVSSEKYTSRLTSAALYLIKVYDKDTERFTTKRVDPTSFIMASRNLIDDIIYGRITFNESKVASKEDSEQEKKRVNNHKLAKAKFLEAIKDFHSNPVRNSQIMLELLFGDVEENGNKRLLNDIHYGNAHTLTTSNDLNILYSTYHAIFDSKNPNSLFSIEGSNKNQHNSRGQSIMGEIAGYIDRNVSMHYLEIEYNHETGQPVLKIKRKFANNQTVAKTIKNINGRIHAFTDDKKQSLQDKYQFRIDPAGTGSKSTYSVTIGDQEYQLATRSDMGKIFYNQGQTWTAKVDDLPIASICSGTHAVDIITFRNKILNNSNFDEQEQKLYDILKFIDDYLDLGIFSNPDFNLQVLQVYKGIYAPSKSEGVFGTYYLEPLMKLAMRAAYANAQEVEAKNQGVSLEEYLRKDDLFIEYLKHSNVNRNFSQLWGDIKHTIASRNDGVIALWADAFAMLSGQASKATTKDKQGNSIPNNSVNKLGNMLPYYLRKQYKGDGSSADLLFASNASMIKSVYHEMEVTSWNGESKSVKAFTSGELIQNSFINKFWGQYINNGQVVIQPTTYSDKTTFLNWLIDATVKGVDLLDMKTKSEDFHTTVANLYRSTIGQAYKNAWSKTIDKLTTIMNHVNSTRNTKFTDIQSYLNSVSESQLIADARAASNTLGYNIEVELDKDYRKASIKLPDGRIKNICAVNELFDYYANELYETPGVLEAALDKQKINFVDNILSTNTYFTVLDFNDSYANYLKGGDIKKGTSNNPIMAIIKKVFDNNVEGRESFFKNWVDEESGRLIIAKQNGKNIIGTGSTLDFNSAVELNPLLDRFFYVEGLYSNNLRMSLTGTEVNHPDKAKLTTYNLVKSFKTLQDFKNDGLSDEEALAKYNAQVDRINSKLAGTYTDVQLLEAKQILKNNTINTSSLKYLDNKYKTPLIQDIREETLLNISNVAQGTQFKRNVIIPATLQYCRQNHIDGIPAKIKCAVIRDEKAHVWNYRGDHEKDIDSADGSAKITPFQSILENMSLDSQAVGFTKKPIWHSYDANGLTAFLAKFATSTITNEEMRYAINSHTNLHNLFRKMTNLQWEKGDVDLLETTTEKGKLEANSYNVDEWFSKYILKNVQLDDNSIIYENRLLYQNAYYEGNNTNNGITEIFYLDKTVSAEAGDLYYTLEGAYSPKRDATKAKKVYHLFYDSYNDNGQLIEESKHITFDTDEKAKKFMREHANDSLIQNVHTINSLYELHTALGGIYCCDNKGKTSEFNNLAVVNFMNNVGRIRPGHNRAEIQDQTTYEQPLKKYHIGYALNNTAVKNGAKNINQAERWHNNEALDWFEVDSDGLGMQMNADHDIIGSELTEFSQVVTATSAYGYTHDQCNEIFVGLSKTAFQASESTLRAVDAFLNEFADPTDKLNAQNKLYDAIGRIIFTNQSIKSTENLQGIIMQAVSKIFNDSKHHEQDEYKIPFSDANVYADFVSTLASTITKESIKRKHPGSGCVMVAGYNMVQYYEVDGQRLMADDLLYKARQDYRQDLIERLKNYGIEKGIYNEKEHKITIKDSDVCFSDLTQNLEAVAQALKLEPSEYYVPDMDTTARSKHFIKTYLAKKQAAEYTPEKMMDTAEFFMPSDIVDIVREDGTYVDTIDMDNLDDYYKLKDGVFEAQAEYNVSIKADYGKGKYTITLKDESGKNTNQSFVIEAEQNASGAYTGKYNIHFSTGSFDDKLQRRIKGTLSPEEKNRLFAATMRVLPVGATLRLSPTTEEQLKSGIGGLTTGSVVGYNSIFENTIRQGGAILEKGVSYPVNYFDANGIAHSQYVSEYTKVGQNTTNYRYTNNVTRPRNLKPSLIRWKYLGQDGKEHWANIFDHSVIRNSYTQNYNLPEEHRKRVQNVLHDLEKGWDSEHNCAIIEGSLENTAAELIMSNLYQDKFNTEGYSLQQILDMGEDFFMKNNSMNAPADVGYDIAYVSDQGEHTLITLGNVKVSDKVYKVQFDQNRLKVNDKDEIVLMKGGRELFEVGRWATPTSKISYQDGKFVDANNIPVQNQQDYRLKDKNDANSVQKKIMYVEAYEVVAPVKKGSKQVYKSDTLYKIASIDKFIEGMKGLPALGSPELDAVNQRAAIINKMFGNHSAIYLNSRSWKAEHLLQVKRALSRVLTNYYIDQDVKDLLNTQISHLANNSLIIDAGSTKEETIRALKANTKDNIKSWKEATNEFLRKKAHKKWISFQDSLNFIASRIPAQTLQSFMSMKQIAWTSNSKNMAYVSHFQTYLQGSDYDIDKAYIMGQSYNDSATYIGWSNLFDYSTYDTLQASKTLPVPRGHSNMVIDSSANDNNIDEFFKISSDGSLDSVAPELKAKAIRLVGNIIRNYNKKNILYYSGPQDNKLNTLIKLIDSHQTTKLHASIAESAYKNVASSNIYAVAHDIRNRDQAYTAIAMDILQAAAANSPKGDQAGRLNMFNPFTKYMMQYQNLVGKNVISIAANGEKVWFNSYYYWHQVLKNGSPEDINRLKYQQTFHRIAGRASNTMHRKTVRALPDLNTRDAKITQLLLNEFQVEAPDLEYTYVDQLISQLLSAATDNAKELILAKINAGTNFARMYVYAMMSGYAIDDIVAFMTSPVSEFIDGLSSPNMFQGSDANNNATSAINAAFGIIGIKRFLHGTITRDGMTEDGYPETQTVSKSNAVKSILSNKFKNKLYSDEEKVPPLGALMKDLINYAITDSSVNLVKVYKEQATKDMEIYNYLTYCQDIIEKLRQVRSKYNTQEDFEGDIREFKKLYDLSTEVSTIASSWLGLNQGLPSSELDIIKRLVSMSKIVQKRESALGIVDKDMYNRSDVEIQTDEDWDEEEVEYKAKKSETLEEEKAATIQRILDNRNGDYDNDVTLLTAEEAITRLDMAHANGLINNFDIVKYLKNENGYRQKIIDYYGLIMGSLNVFDMMDKIPHYTTTIECLKSLVVANDLAGKSRFINKLLPKNETVTDDQLRGLIRFADKTFSKNFLQTLPYVNPKGMVRGFNSDFSDTEVDSFNLGTLEGIAGFRQWVETDFLDMLKDKYASNPLVKHFKVIHDDNGNVLATDIDLLNPNLDLTSKVAYDEILRGMAEFERTNYDGNYSIVDILQLYNIAVNNNAAGGERLTTAFKVCSSKNNVLNKYLKYLGDLDYDMDTQIDYDQVDYLINSAPVVSEYTSKFQTAKFIKVKDPVRGYVLKIKNGNGDYTEYNMVPSTSLQETSAEKMRRTFNFATKCPYEFIHSHNQEIMTQTLAFGSIQDLNPQELEELRNRIYNVLKDFTTSNKLWIYKVC